MNTSKLLKAGFFPKKLPPPFNTVNFGTLASNRGVLNIRSGYISKPCIHNLARPGHQRRMLSIPNPFNYFLISKLLENNTNEIYEVLTRSQIGVSKPIEDDNNLRAFISATEIKELVFHKAKVRSGARYILKADISRFYHSIYTHSIPWAIKGKAWSKANRSGGFANDLDKLLRNSQDGQTLGIPIGPDSSLIVSELIACAIDEQIQKQGLKGYRFVDDYEFAFLTRSEAEEALPILETILREYELALNPLKCQVCSLPTPFDRPWKTVLKSIIYGSKFRVNDLLEYFDLLFDLHNKNVNEPVLRYSKKLKI